MENKITWAPTIKQMEAWNYLNDFETTELFFGGAAGGGKSFLGCFWILSMCLKYEGSRWLIGRAILKTLKESTLLTMFHVLKQYGFKRDEDYKYNSMEASIKFFNGSEIYLKDLFAYPSDPLFDELGSTEFTGAFIDEGSQVSHQAYQILMSRIRYRLDEFKTIPKILICSNPTKNFLYADFYTPWKKGTLPKYKKFVPALVGENQYISKYYIENLHKLDEISKQRLLYGNFEYDDDPTKLFEYDKILDIFNNFFSQPSRTQKYLSVDVARHGSDQTVIMEWHGMNIIKIKAYPDTTTKFVREEIERICYFEKIPMSNVIIDEDGIGGGVIDEMNGVKGFINNSRAIEAKETQEFYNHPPKHNYANLKSQCYFLLSNYVNEGKIGCYKEIPMEIKDWLIQDLQQIKVKDADKDGKLAVIGKDEIKDNLGRSPDFSDSMMMRMYFELKGEYRPYIVGGRIG